tara:strand:- start:48 stop:332 length:285 start_codon:yes stop_codon:yes gene_type:complete
MFGKQSRAISPRIFLLTGTFLTAVKSRFSFLSIFFIFRRTESISLSKKICPIANSSLILIDCSFKSVSSKKFLSKSIKIPHPSPVLPSAPMAPL